MKKVIFQFSKWKRWFFSSQKNDNMIFSLVWNTMFTGYQNVLVFKFSKVENTVFFQAKKLMETWYLFIYLLYWTALVLNFSEIGNAFFFEPKSWWKHDIYLFIILNRSCFKLFRDGKCVLFWAKMLMERWHLLLTEKFLFWTLRWWQIWSFFQSKRWWKDDIYLVFLSFPWYSRTWEICFFVQCNLKLYFGVFLLMT